MLMIFNQIFISISVYIYIDKYIYIYIYTYVFSISTYIYIGLVATLLLRDKAFIPHPMTYMWKCMKKHSSLE